ncbi:hypothetical protein Vadar_032182 [Vaccinium darrowii]|uniref:Uncharacterized protein n=1 Tax=Vaccinium darrowii TaxID=229202 RepID=A0ACB7X5U6_9ERIC|nr:hypothetical protein Vadar_032182 [Vaccinium darrowii]
MGLETVIFEGDSQALVRVLDSAVACPVDIEVIVEDIRRGKHRFKECDFQFARRTANTVADKLATNGLQCVGTRTWEFRPPDWLREFLDRDLC